MYDDEMTTGPEDEAEVEAHRFSARREDATEAATEAANDDVEGHKVSQRRGIDDEDDVEGHKVSQRRGTDDEDDVEGHRISVRRP